VKGLLQRLDKFLNGTNGTRVVALVIAIFTFYSIKKLISKEVDFWVEVLPMASDIAEGKTFVQSDPTEVRVTLQGSPEQLASVNKEDVKLMSRIREGTEGTNVLVTLERSWISGHGKTRVRKIEPNQATLLFDEKGEVELPIARPEIIGKPLIGEAEVIWSETNIVARGLKTTLRDLQANAIQVATEPIDVDGRVQSFKRRVKILWPQNITGAVSELEVPVQVNVKTGNKSFERQPVLLTIISGSGASYTSDPDWVTVKVSGSEDALEKLDAGKFAVIATCTRIDDGGAKIPLKIIFDSGLEGLSGEADPPEVDITVHYKHSLKQLVADQEDPPAQSEQEQAD